MSRRVAAIVVNWNGADFLEECVTSLLAQTYEPLEVIVVDNASSDSSASVVASMPVKWVSLPRNMGLARANNEGAKAARSELLLFLNNDMRFATDFVAHMVSCLERHPRCWAVDAIQRDWENQSVVHAATQLARGSGLERIPGWTFKSVDARSDGVTAWPSGANTLIAASTLQRLGGWDARFFAGYEDVDLGWRIWLEGGEVRLASDAVSWHRVGGSSTDRGLEIRKVAAVHGPLLFALKHAPPTLLVATVTRAIGGIAVAVLRRDRTGARAQMRALSAARNDAFAAFRWRRITYSRCRATPRKLWRRIASMTPDSAAE